MSKNATLSDVCKSPALEVRLTEAAAELKKHDVSVTCSNLASVLQLSYNHVKKYLWYFSDLKKELGVVRGKVYKKDTPHHVKQRKIPPAGEIDDHEKNGMESRVTSRAEDPLLALLRQKHPERV